MFDWALRAEIWAGVGVREETGLNVLFETGRRGSLIRIRGGSGVGFAVATGRERGSFVSPCDCGAFGTETGCIPFFC